jgi:hypothetical protein
MGPLPRFGERSQLPLPPDERRAEAPFRGRARHRDEAPGEHGLALALHGQGLDRLGLDQVPGETQRRLGEEGFPGLRRLLQARRDIDGVTRREALLGTRDHLARADADPPLDSELLERQLHLRRRP